MPDYKNTPEEYWRKKLTPKQYHVLREGGTDAPFNNTYYHQNNDGMYVCAACGKELFSSATKFESKSGWPSFDNPVNLEHIELEDDNSLGMSRTEVKCKNCGSHLGHLFEDGPTRTGKRFCINSTSLDFKPK